MTVTECPLPEVAQALEPYIKPRDEVSNIRRALHSLLEANATSGNEPLSVLNLSKPSVSEPSESPNALTGVRKAYWRAVQAHQAAQARLDALKAELGSMTTKLPERDIRPAGENVVHLYIPLLRQKQRQRKLLAVERAVSSITAGGNEILTTSLDDAVRTKVGDLPIPPIGQTHGSGAVSTSDDLILQLKKAVILARNKADSQETRVKGRAAGNRITGRPAEIELRALRAAHTELTTWIEEQLARISRPEPEPETSSIGKGYSVNGTNTGETTIAKMHELYEQYIVARESLVQTMSGRDESQESDITVDLSTKVNESDLQEHRTTPALTMLPYIQRLTSIAQEEKTLLLQSSYLRRQLTSAEAETQRLIARLADESHLVHPGASRGKEWAEAGEESGQATHATAEERLRAGKAAMAEADRALEGIRGVPGLLDQVTPRDS